MPPIPAIVSGQLLIYAIYDVADEADLVKVERVVRARPSVDGERITRLQLEQLVGSFVLAWLALPVGKEPATLTARMRRKIDQPQSRRIYSRRLAIVEPVFAMYNPGVLGSQ